MMLSSTKSLLVVTAVIELATGILLLISPSLTTKLLLGAVLGTPESVLIARIGGAALLSIGVCCWMERHRDRNGPMSGVLTGLLVYNAAVAALLVYGAVFDKIHGVGIWPAIGLHSVLLMWCAARLRNRVPTNDQPRSNAAS